MLGLGSRRKVPKMSIVVRRGTESRGKDIQDGARKGLAAGLRSIEKEKGMVK